jgi:hypothetical protein
MSRQMLNGNVLHGRSNTIMISEGKKMCQDCSMTFSSTDVHSCVYFLQQMLRTIVGEKTFENA